jgi:uncharacterized protein YidB (DUF937 family)
MGLRDVLIGIQNGPGGSLNDFLRGGLGGLLGGAAAGSVLSGGLGNLIRDLQSSGHGDVADSWCIRGPTGRSRRVTSSMRWAATRSTRSAGRPGWTATISWKG